MPNPPAASDDDLHDMQSLIGSGLPTLRHSEYLLLDVVDAASARGWLRSIRGKVHAVSSLVRADAAQDPRQRSQHAEAWSVAFTYRGLVQLGVVEDRDAPFPSAFRDGQAAPVRRRLLRDPRPDEPWAWGDVPVFDEADATTRAAGAVSILVARFFDDARRAAPALEPPALRRGGLRQVRRIRGCAASFRQVGPTAPGEPAIHLYEPFGFRDGLSQPLPEGLRFDRARKHLQDPPDATAGMADDDRVPLGEFVLGHPNGYQELSHCPDAQRASPSASGASPFGRNGSYLAVRQIHQDVGAFRDFEARCAQNGEPGAAERMLGRRKDGSPLQTCPQTLAATEPLRFRMNDSQGFQCPTGAHVRRANPRDMLAASVDAGIASSKLHRLLRRGRPYAACQDPRECAGAEPLPDGTTSECAACPTGLMFIAMVADLARQFEFVQRLWIGNPRFDNLDDAGDPIVGEASARRFLLPGVPIGTQIDSLPDFTRVEGGAYFFLPGLSALDRLVAGDFAAAPGSVAAADHRA